MHTITALANKLNLGHKTSVSFLYSTFLETGFASINVF
jgi:hypothetical protein